MVLFSEESSSTFTNCSEGVSDSFTLDETSAESLSPKRDPLVNAEEKSSLEMEDVSVVGDAVLVETASVLTSGLSPDLFSTEIESLSAFAVSKGNGVEEERNASPKTGTLLMLPKLSNPLPYTGKPFPLTTGEDGVTANPLKSLSAKPLPKNGYSEKCKMKIDR